MKIHRLYTKNFLRNYDYIVETICGKVIVVDPSDLDLLKGFLSKRGLDSIDYYFITHEHGDHIQGLRALHSLMGGEVVADRSLVGQLPVRVHRPVEQGDRISFKGGFFQVLSIPGHIKSHIGFIQWEGEGEGEGRPRTAFLGDTLFNGGVGNTREGSSQVLYETFSQKIFPLEKDIVFYPEHDYWNSNLRFTLSLEPENKRAKELLSSYLCGDYGKSGQFPSATLGEEREYNLFFRTHLPHVRTAITRECSLGEDCLDRDVFVSLRSLRDQWRG